MTTPHQSYQGVDSWITDEAIHRRALARASNNQLKGKLNVGIDVTLTPSASTTTITDARIGITTAVIPGMPLTLNGAIALDSGIWFDAPVSGSAVVHHAAAVAVDQTIRFVLIG